MLPRVSRGDQILHSSQFYHLATSESVALVLIIFILEGADDEVDVLLLLVLDGRVRGIGPCRKTAILLFDTSRIEKLYPVSLVLILEMQAPQQLMIAELPVLQLLSHLEPHLTICIKKVLLALLRNMYRYLGVRSYSKVPCTTFLLN